MGASTRGLGTGVMTEGQETEDGDEDEDEDDGGDKDVEGGVCRGEGREIGGEVLDLWVERSTGSVWVWNRSDGQKRLSGVLLRMRRSNTSTVSGYRRTSGD